MHIVLFIFNVLFFFFFFFLVFNGKSQNIEKELSSSFTLMKFDVVRLKCLVMLGDKYV